MRLLLSAWFLLAMAHAAAQPCAPTPEAAAMAIIGATEAAPLVTGSSGYRVQDVRVDLLMARVWVRVRQCGDPSAPLVLVPLRATLAGRSQVLQPASLIASTTSANEAVQQPLSAAVAPISVHAGEAVKAVFLSTNVRMEMDATANGQAAIGGLVEITLAKRGDETPHRMHGVLRAPGRVEVQP